MKTYIIWLDDEKPKHLPNNHTGDTCNITGWWMYHELRADIWADIPDYSEEILKFDIVEEEGEEYKVFNALETIHAIESYCQEIADGRVPPGMIKLSLSRIKQMRNTDYYKQNIESEV